MLLWPHLPLLHQYADMLASHQFATHLYWQYLGCVHDDGPSLVGLQNDLGVYQLIVLLSF